MRRTFPLFMAFIMAAIAIPVTAIVLMFGVDLVANFYSSFTPTSVGQFTEADLDAAIGNGFKMYALMPLVPVAGVLLAVLVGGKVSSSMDRDSPNPPSSGPPF